uniref:Uncharacterized protein n=1 Tax=Cucumis sativus TaxID=3659 RepID=A0A0A0K6E4_CUCSA
MMVLLGLVPQLNEGFTQLDEKSKVDHDAWSINCIQYWRGCSDLCSRLSAEEDSLWMIDQTNVCAILARQEEDTSHLETWNVDSDFGNKSFH